MSYRSPDSEWENSEDDYSEEDSGDEIIEKIIDVDDDKLIELINNKNYDELSKIFMVTIKLDNLTYYIYQHCKKSNSIKLLNYLHDTYNINSIEGNTWSSYIYIGKCNNDFIDVFLKYVNINIETIEKLFDTAISNSNMYMIKKLEDMNYNIDYTKHRGLIVYGSIEILNYVIPQDYFQKAFEYCYNNSDRNYLKIDIDRLKYLVSVGVDITNSLDVLMMCGVKNDNFEIVKYCHDVGGIITPEMLKQAILYKYHPIINYFLDNGANISQITIDDYDYYTFDSKIVKVLMDNNYKFTDDFKGKMFKNIIIENGIDDVMDTFSYINFDCIIDLEKYNLENYPDKKEYSHMQWSLAKGEHFMCKYVLSPFEYIVHDNKINHVKFVLSKCSDKLDINKLFIVAISNNRLEMAKTLLDVDSNVDYDTAMECACLFGHYDMVMFLLKFGVEINKNLMDMVVYGTNYSLKRIGYQQILKKVNILNDIMYTGEGYKKIISFLVENGINFTIETLKNLGYTYYDLDIINQLLNDGHSEYELLTVCATIVFFPHSKEYSDTFNIPKHYEEILEYLLNKGTNPNIDGVTNIKMKKLLEKYK